MRNIIQIFLVYSTALLIIFGTSCNESTTTNHKVYNDTSNLDTSNTKNLIYHKYNIPLPADYFIFLKENKAIFSRTILNQLTKREKYVTDVSRAINLGVYSTDLAYCIMFERAQESMDYLNAAKEMADKLDIYEGFNVALIRRFEDNLYNTDSLKNIVQQSYENSCNYLEKNNKINILPFVVFGGWIESLFILKNTEGHETSKELIIKKFSEQKEGVSNLIDYLYNVLTQSSTYYFASDVKVLILKLNEIKGVYEKMDETKGLTEEQYQKLSKLVIDLRTEYTNP